MKRPRKPAPAYPWRIAERYALMDGLREGKIIPFPGSPLDETEKRLRRLRMRAT